MAKHAGLKFLTLKKFGTMVKLFFLIIIFCATTASADVFSFCIKTKNKSIVGNVSIQAKDQYQAETKLKARYPGCTILRCKKR